MYYTYYNFQTGGNMSATNHAATQAIKKGGQQQQTQPQHQQQNGQSAGAVTVSGSSASTPTAQTPNGNMAPQQQQVPPPSQSTSPPANNAPKYGTLVPNRVFVGGISANTTEAELAQLFSAYGSVKATKIISDRAGVSKGYGFVTFESEEEAKRLQRESDNIMFRERRLNIAPAIKKQPFNRSFEVPSPPPNANTPAQYYYAAAAAAAAAAGGAVPYPAAYQNGMAYYATPPQTTANGADPNTAAQPPVYQAPPVYATPTAAAPPAPYPMPMYPHQPLFVHQQYPYQPIPYDPQQFYGSGGQGIGVGGGSAQYALYGGGTNGGGGAMGAGGPQQQQQQSGGGTGNGGNTGANAGPANSAASPARHHHHHHQQHPPPPPHTGYYQQLAYNASDGMYYNVPMYATIDSSTGIYTEGIDTTTLTAIEGMHAHYADPLLGAPASLPPSSTPPGGQLSTGAMPKHNPHLNQQPQPPHSQSQLRIQHPHRTYNVSYQPIPIAERNGYVAPQSEKSSTPVVSLLNVGASNERDYRSMQGGRKYKPDSKPPQPQDNNTPTIPTYNHANNLNGGGIQSFRISQPMNYMYQHLNNVNGFLHNGKNNYNNKKNDTNKCDSNQCRTWSKKRRNYNNCVTESSSMSSVRTSSNSSANAVFDENLNEKKDKIPNNDSCVSPISLPVSHSPMTFQNSSMSHDYTATNTHNYPQNIHHRNVFQPHGTTTYYSHHQSHQGGGGMNNSRRNRRSNVRRNNSHGHGPNGSQMGSQQYHQRDQREHARDRDQRPALPTEPAAEIGAGDAPLPTEVNEVCKKMDSIKL